MLCADGSEPWSKAGALIHDAAAARERRSFARRCFAGKVNVRIGEEIDCRQKVVPASAVAASCVAEPRRPHWPRQVRPSAARKWFRKLIRDGRKGRCRRFERACRRIGYGDPRRPGPLAGRSLPPKGCSLTCSPCQYVVDNVPVRGKVVDYFEEDDCNRQLRSCHAYKVTREWIYSPSRIKYPMKRKGWQPGGGENSNGQMRGKDEWERISWDEALDLCASEIKRIYETYSSPHAPSALSAWAARFRMF